MRRALWASAAVIVALIVAVAVKVRATMSALIVEREEDLWPDPRVREGFRLESLRNAVRAYARDHADALPPNLETVVRWIPVDERAPVSSWLVDLWGTTVRYEVVGPRSFVLRSAGVDRVWGTADDVAFFEPRPDSTAADSSSG